MTKSVQRCRDARLCLIRVGLVLYTVTVMFAIFMFSSQSGEKSGTLSGEMLRMLLGWLGIDGPAELVELLHLLLRKFAHFSIYALLGIGVMGTALTFEGKSRKKFLLALVICVGYAATDEFHQLFVGARCGSPLDVMLDSCGAVCGCGVTVAARWLWRRVRGRHKTWGNRGSYLGTGSL